LASRIKQKKHLSFSALKNALSVHINTIPDPRQSRKCVFSYHDILMSAFACMYFQEPLLLQFQQRREQAQGRNNLRNLFGVGNIPQESHTETPLILFPGLNLQAFSRIILNASGDTNIWKRTRYYRMSSCVPLMAPSIIARKVFACMDAGKGDLSGAKITHCDCCLSKEHKTGEITYSHSVLQGAIMHPDKQQVLPMMPEAIQNTDGSKKQDCESKAAKRFLGNLKATHPRQQFMISGDGLMSHQPMIESVKENGMHYVFVAKPGDHAYLFEWIHAFDDLPKLEVIDEKGRRHCYRWQNDVPLQGEQEAIRVNFFEYSLFNKES